MDSNALQLQIQSLERRIDSEEAKYKEALSLQKNYPTLKEIKENTRNLKQQLQTLKENAKNPD